MPYVTVDTETIETSMPEEYYQFNFKESEVRAMAGLVGYFLDNVRNEEDVHNVDFFVALEGIAKKILEYSDKLMKED